ncbi:MAG: ABC transporter ATP-binding protein [Flavobacterium sp.]|nr:MAG: ABC transporter ATP-binding protein [Flavobacterium sp.]
MAKAIAVENVSKQYRLGQIGTGSLTHDINRWWHTVRGKEDPYLKIGETNDRTSKGNSQYVWSLRDINFEIEQGDSVGIIGRNGAGKSTLLKILSRVTAPSTGSVKVKGRIASLLEVGTGFHPELSGRDNIFLNGAILGMRKHEIKRKFDEIVDFAGVERYIDTPVKRYSSGMYVRLAFAVAAYLESEILIVDEVLAVGDAEFQKKCLGKMNDISTSEGRTILFVSHNMAAIKNFCKKVVILKHGNIEFQGFTNKGIDHYINSDSGNNNNRYVAKEKQLTNSYFEKIEVVDQNFVSKSQFEFNEFVLFHLSASILDKHLGGKISLRITDNLERIVFTTEVPIKDYLNTGGSIHLQVRIPKELLVPNSYKGQLAIHIPNVEIIEILRDVIQFSIVDTGSKFFMYGDVDYGCVFAACEWTEL